MRTDGIVYGPNHWYYANYFTNEDGGWQYGYALNDADDAVGIGFRFNKSGTISGFGMYLIDIIGDPPDYQFGVVTVSGTSGGEGHYPSDTLYGGGAWQTFDPVVVGSGWSWININTPITATRGDQVAAVVKPTASAPDTSNYIEINDESTWLSGHPGSWRHYTSWSWYPWIVPAALKYTDNSITGMPAVAHHYELISSPEEWGVEFQLPVGATCLGSVISLYNVGNDAAFKIILADSSDTELASVTIDDVDFVGNSDWDFAYVTWDSPSSDPILVSDTSYRLYLKPTSGTVNKHGLSFNEESDKNSQIGGTDWKWIERSAPASGWTYHATRYPWISVYLTDLQGGSGNGGTGGGEGGAAFGFIG